MLIAVAGLEALGETIAVLADSEAVRTLQSGADELARGEGENGHDLTAAMNARRARA